jgi:phosphoribosyl-AMP cyclohydrolase / phosphoribosyl-ATP pyrophosphohydrolase
MLISASTLDSLDFARAAGLLPVVAQHALTGEVLMLGYTDRAALENTLASNDLWFYSRSRAELWRKGDTSGNIMHVVALHADCDRDAILALVLPAGPACHTGDRTCFAAPPTLQALADTISARFGSADDRSYTRRLFDDPNLRLKKLGEEAVELALACSAGDAAAAAEEAADLLYHTLVACRAAGVTLADVLAVLERRSERASPAEKNAIDRQ